MNDKLLMENYLLILKSTIEVYIHGTLESSNQDVRKILKQGLDETLKHQENTYNEMNKYDFYKVTNINCNEITKAINNLNNN